MGECRFCHKDAGLFRKEHQQCRDQFDKACALISQTLDSCFDTKTDFYLKASQINAAVSSGYVDGQSREDIFIKSLDRAVEKYLEDGIIQKDEYSTIARFIQFCGIPQDRINVNHSLDKVVQSQIIADILAGNVPVQRFTTDKGDFPFMLEKNEVPLWIFRNVTMHEQKTVRQTVGGHSGFNIRVMKGVYYRIGGYKGRPVETTSMHKIGTGAVCLTNKNIYFSSPVKSFKTAYSKIISMNSYSNGIDFQKDGANAKPIFLEGVDSWFCHNIIANLK